MCGPEHAGMCTRRVWVFLSKLTSRLYVVHVAQDVHRVAAFARFNIHQGQKISQGLHSLVEFSLQHVGV